MRSSLRFAIVVSIAGWIAITVTPPPAACTSAVVGPEASVTGNPLLWKNRDTPVLDKKVVFIGRSASGEPLRVVEIGGGGSGQRLGIMLPCGFDVDALDDAFRGLINGADLDGGEADDLDLVLVPRAEAMEAR